MERDCLCLYVLGGLMVNLLFLYYLLRLCYPLLPNYYFTFVVIKKGTI